VLGVSVHGALLHVNAEAADARPEIEAGLAGAGITVRRLEPAQPSLEDVFIRLVDHQRGSQNAASET
jgi:ABC-type uncharacterized transport system ATPase subunit